MSLSLKRLCLERIFACFLFFVMTLFLSACERVPSTNTIPVFTITNLPILKRENTKIINVLNSDNQTSQITEPLEPHEELVKAPTSSEPQKIDTSDKTDTTYENKTITEKAENVLKEVKIEDNKDSKLIDPSRIAHAEKHDESEILKAEEQVDITEETKTTQSFEPKLENDKDQLLESKHSKSTEIASIINIPPTKPQVERIKLKTLMNYSPSDLEDMMGKPNFVLHTENMSLWQYEAGDCIIDFFLSLNRDQYYVSFIDVRASRLGENMDIYTCEHEVTNALNL